MSQLTDLTVEEQLKVLSSSFTKEELAKMFLFTSVMASSVSNVIGEITAAKLLYIYSPKHYAMAREVAKLTDIMCQRIDAFKVQKEQQASEVQRTQEKVG